MFPGRECASGSSFYQLCYSPLFGNFSDHILHLVGFRCLRGGSAQVVVRSTNCANAPYGFPEALRGSFPRFSSAGLETILERGILGTQWE